LNIFDVSDGVHFNAKTPNNAVDGNRALAQEMDNIKDALSCHCGIFHHQ